MGSGAWTLVPDSANPNSPWANIKVRQAAQYAIDTDAIVKTILNGEAEAVNQWSPKAHWGYNPSVVGYPYNPTKAKQLLSEAGYQNGFKTKITYRTGPEWDQVYTAIQGYLKVAGIEAELDPAQVPRWFQAIQGGTWEGLLAGNPSGEPDVAAQLALRWGRITNYYAKMFLPDEIARTIQNAIIARDFEAKQKWVQEAQKLMVDKYCFIIMLYSENDSAVSQSYVHNHGCMGISFGGAWTPEDAWLGR